MLPFRPLSWEDKEPYTECYKRCPVHYADYTFFSLWGWREAVSFELAFTEGLCWVRSNGRICGPIGEWESADWESVLRGFAPGESLYGVPKDAAAHFPPAMPRKPERDQWEYVYAVQDLIALKGSKYAHKRNRVRAFLSNYEWDYFPMLPEDFPAVLEFQERWRAHRDSEMTPEEAASLEVEDRAIRAALERWEDFPFLGGLLKVDDAIIAYTIAEELDDTTLDIRFEKAFGEYAGSYQAINQIFLKNQGTSYTWVNREEDMGEPGLRASKLSYNPVRMLETYTVEITPPPSTTSPS